MATGAEHFLMAETLLDKASLEERSDSEWAAREQYLIQKASAHATLALAAAVHRATCLAHGDDSPGYGR